MLSITWGRACKQLCLASSSVEPIPHAAATAGFHGYGGTYPTQTLAFCSQFMVPMLPLLCSVLIDTAHLGHDSWAVRCQAEARLSWTAPVALPVLVPLSLVRDPEVRHRAARLVRPYGSRLQGVVDHLLLANILWSETWPQSACQWLEQQPLELAERLTSLAIDWGVYPKGHPFTFQREPVSAWEKWGWVGDARQRVGR